MTSPAHSAGFTLTELLIAMAIMAIITMSAVPMLTELRERLQARRILPVCSWLSAVAANRPCC